MGGMRIFSMCLSWSHGELAVHEGLGWNKCCFRNEILI